MVVLRLFLTSKAVCDSGGVKFNFNDETFKKIADEFFSPNY